MLNSVIIGAGIIGKAHFDAYKEVDNVNLVAAVEIDVEAGRKNFNDEIPIYKTLEEALANHKVDMVDICTPTFNHVELSVKALNAGLHVLCEKPMSKTAAEAAVLTEAAEKSDKLFMIAHVVRFMAPYMYLKSIVESKELGKLVKLQLTRASGLPQNRPDDWILDPEISGGTVIDMNIHDLDFAKDVFGKPNKIQGVYHKLANKKDDNWICANLIYDDFAITVEGGWFSYPIPFVAEYCAVFENGIVESKGDKITKNAQEVDLSEFSVTANSGIKLTGKNGYADEIAYFASCIEKGVQPIMVTAKSSEESVALAQQVVENSISI